MSDLSVVIVEDKLQLAVLDALAQMTKPAYGINIMTAVVASTREGYMLETIMDALVELVLAERVTSRYDDPGSARQRRLYSLVVPSSMTLYGPKHPDYPNLPEDWNGKGVLCMNGDFWVNPPKDIEAAWEYENFRDGKDIIAYFNN